MTIIEIAVTPAITPPVTNPLPARTGTQTGEVTIAPTVTNCPKFPTLKPVSVVCVVVIPLDAAEMFRFATWLQQYHFENRD